MHRALGSSGCWCAESTRGKYARRLGSGFVRAVDEHDVGTEQFGQDRLEQRVMRAAEYDRVDARSPKGREILVRDQPRCIMVDPPFLNEGNEQRAGTRNDVCARSERANGAFVGARADRARSPDDSELFPRRRGNRSTRSRLDDADHGNGELLLQHRQSMRRCRVARDHDRLNVLRCEVRADLTTIPSHGVGTLRTVRDTRSVTKVNDALMRQLAHDLAHDGEATEARVENSDW